MTDFTAGVCVKIRTERAAQVKQWGEQHHPDGTGGAFWQFQAEVRRNDCFQATTAGTLDALNLNEVPLDDMLHTVARLAEQRDVAHDHRGELLPHLTAEDWLRRHCELPAVLAYIAAKAKDVEW